VVVAAAASIQLKLFKLEHDFSEKPSPFFQIALRGRPMRILVIGRHGQVASALARRGLEAAQEVTCLGREELNVFSGDAIAGAISRCKPEALVNAAAYTAVDKAEDDQEAAFGLNAGLPRLLAEISAAQEIPFIQLSTDYVFDGSKPEPYHPDDPVNPVSIYGASKAAGELAVAAANPQGVVLRTAWVYSNSGSNFVKRMLELGAERDELRIVDDQIGNPTFADDIADACFRILGSKRLRDGMAGGIYHFAGQGDVTWYGFAEAIFDEARRQHRDTPARLIAITSDQYPTPARRPANSRLHCATSEATFDLNRRPWLASLKQCLQRPFA
jgi:dTDP-4-dehydrorhamnose reductase